MTDRPSSKETREFHPDDLEDKLEGIAEDFIERLHRGDTPDRNEIVAEHPEIADALDRRLSFLEMMYRRRFRAAEPVAEPHTTRVPEVEVPDRIGPYRVLDALGMGGMGVVYLAEQDRPVRRKVAVKLMKAGLDTEVLLARFESEQQALALMNHPGIARVFDAGATETGRPYFAMEHVAGRPITRYCDDLRLALVDRLELFRKVCDAVQHAHQKGIIHRDLKPSNILVTAVDGEAIPKVIDFGIAKAIHHKLTDLSLHTQMGQVIGTPEYMSPEQAGGALLDVDTRTDVYSLGVVLYELLTGSLPFELADARRQGIREIQRRIREEEPSKPSTRVSSLGDDSQVVARCRRMTTKALSRRLSRDLDWIVLKALEKDRARRYATSSELGADIARHLGDEPVLARPPSTAYRIGKFVRKHRGKVAAGLALATTVLVALVVSLALYVKATDEAEKSRKLGEFLTQRIAERNPWSPDTIAGGDSETPLADMLERIEREIPAEFADYPEIRADLWTALGRAYGGLNENERSLELLERAVETRGELLGVDHPDTLESLHHLSRALSAVGEYRRAEEIIRAVVAERERIHGRRSVECLESLDWLGLVIGYAGYKGDADEAIPIWEEVLGARRSILGREHPDTLMTMDFLAISYRDYRAPEGYEKAEKLLEESLGIKRRVLGDGHVSTLRTLGNLAYLYRARAERRFRESEELRRKSEVLKEGGDEEQARVDAERSAALLDEVAGDLEAAEMSHREVVAGHQALAAPGETSHAWKEPFARVLRAQARVLRVRGDTEALRVKLEEAERVARDAYLRPEFGGGRKAGPAHQSASTLGTILILQGRKEEALAIYREFLDVSRSFPLDQYFSQVNWTLITTHLLIEMGELEEAEDLARRALAACEMSPEPVPGKTIDVRTRLGEILRRRGAYPEAEEHLFTAHREAKELEGPDGGRRTQASGREIFYLYEAWGKPKDAEAFASFIPPW